LADAETDIRPSFGAFGRKNARSRRTSRLTEQSDLRRTTPSGAFVTTSHLPRRAVVGAVLAVAMIGGGLVAAFADDAPAAAGGCPATYTDPAGDSGLLDPSTNPAVGDDDLDLVAITHSVDGGVFTTAFKVAKLDPAGPLYAAGDRFAASFTVAKKAVTVDAERDFSGAGDTNGSVTVDGAAVTVPVKIVEDDKASRLSALIAVADLEKAVGAPLTGEAFSAMSAEARGFYPSNATPSLGVLWDDATAPATAAYAFGGGCGGGDTPAAPAPAPSASPSTEPSAQPSPQPSASPAPGGVPASGGLPAADCFTAKDPKGDAMLRAVNGLPVDVAAPNDPDLDVTSLTLGTDAKNLKAYIKVDKLGDAPAYSDGHRFYVSFTFNKHSFTMAGSSFANGEGAFRDGLNSTGQVAASTQLAVDGTTSSTDPGRFTGPGPGFVPSGLKFTFDVKNSLVIASLPLADLEKYGKAPSSGAVLSSVYASGNSDYVASAIIVDTVPDGATGSAPGKLTYTMGDNHCFAPPAPPLSNLGVTKAQYGDVAVVAAKLVDAAGAAVAGKTVTFSLGASKASGVTGADGVAKASMVVKDKAGKRSLAITSDSTTVSVPFTVSVEKTALKAAGANGAVTATLTDDDRKPVVGQVITFTSGSKKVTAKTDAKGVAKAAGLPAGNVKVTYPGATGMYAAASTSAKA
jgi:hypothetical protein